MKYNRLCFVTGPARSGTTLLLRMLTGDPHHRNFPESGAITGMAKLYRTQARAEKARFEAFYGSDENLQNLFRAQIDLLISSLLRNETPRDYLFLKDPYLLKSMHGITDLFARVPILAIIRKPDDVLASRWAVAMRRNQPFNLNMQMEELSRDIQMTAYQARAGNLLVIRYEDLINEPHRICDALSERLETQIDPTLSPSLGIENNPFATPRAQILKPVASVDKVNTAFSPQDLENITYTMDAATKTWKRIKTLID